MPLHDAELDRIRQHIHELGRHDWVWWSLGLLSAVLLLGLGLGVYSLAAQPGSAGLDSPQVFLLAFFYLTGVAVSGFHIHSLLRSKESERLKIELLLETLGKEAGRLQGMIDPVTRAYDRSYLEEMVEKEIVRAERHNRPFALVVVDLDRFKQINDQYGHLMGDYVLAEAAQVLRSCVRGSDLVFRYGGDEFVLLLLETQQAGAEAVLSRVHQKVQEWRGKVKVGRLDLSVSTGMSVFAAGKTLQDLLHEADEKMYAMKQRHHAAGVGVEAVN